MKNILRTLDKQKKHLCISIFLVFVLLLSSCGRIDLIADEVAKPLVNIENKDTTMGLLNPDAEVRGIWIATVGNINFPSKSGLSATALSAELDEIIDNCIALGLNTIYFQVRPTADALYKSELFPSSVYVSGKQGKAPDGNFDCLEYLIEEAHKEKINVHAWVNPLRVTYGSAAYPQTDISVLSANHPARQNPDWAIAYADGKLYFDAGNPHVREYIAAGVSEIVENYAVDGIIFDDYFYPYPKTTEGKVEEFNDDASFEAYGGHFDNRADWRRDNINSLVSSCYYAVKKINSECLFGVSPFGIWQNDDGSNGGSATRGLEAYESIYCDALAWVNGGYVDYLSPQLYWRFGTQVAPYGVLTDWWNSKLDGTGVRLIISHAAYMYGEWDSPEGELTDQVTYARNSLCYRGSILYGYEAVHDDFAGIRSEISALFENEIIYSDAVTNYKELVFDGLWDGMKTTEDTIEVHGFSDPSVQILFGDGEISRDKNGEFTVDISLKYGENLISFSYNNQIYKYSVIREEKEQ